MGVLPKAFSLLKSYGRSLWREDNLEFLSRGHFKKGFFPVENFQGV